MNRPAAVSVLLILAMLVGCTAAPTMSSSSVVGGPSYQRYVALGDSYTSGPYIPSTDLAEGCLRSNGNYPSLLAERIDIAALVDVSCSGADTEDLVHSQTTFSGASVPPQFDALTRDTDLVTLGIGVNNLNLFGRLLRTCLKLAPGDPSGAPCTEYFDSSRTDLDRQLNRIGTLVVAALESIAQRSPRARILLVGYPRISPQAGTCPDLLPLATGDYALAVDLQKSLDETMSQAAETAGVEFVGMYAASRGHDICSDDPWVNGRVTDTAAALAFHPFAAGMDAVADRIVDRIVHRAR